MKQYSIMIQFIKLVIYHREFNVTYDEYVTLLFLFLYD